MKAWLVTWEAAGDAAEVADKVAAVISARRSRGHVAECVAFLYSLLSYYPVELLEYARQPSRNPYPVRAAGPWIVCGHNPHLYARLVSKIKVKQDRETGLDTISWVEPDRYEMTEEGPQVAARGEARQFRRRIRGVLSSEQIWDRSMGRFKRGWGPGETPDRA